MKTFNRLRFILQFLRLFFHNHLFFFDNPYQIFIHIFLIFELIDLHLVPLDHVMVLREKFFFFEISFIDLVL